PPSPTRRSGCARAAPSRIAWPQTVTSSRACWVASTGGRSSSSRRRPSRAPRREPSAAPEFSRRRSTCPGRAHLERGRENLVDLLAPSGYTRDSARIPACGAVAQLGERYTRTVEVGGSTPLGSTEFRCGFESGVTDCGTICGSIVIRRRGRPRRRLLRESPIGSGYVLSSGDHRTQSAISFSPSRSWSAILIGLGPVGATGTPRVAKQLPARLGVGRKTMKTLMIGLGTLLLLALTRPALAQRCLSFRPPA